MPAVRFAPRVEPLADRVTPAAWPTEVGHVVGTDDGGSPVVHLFDERRGTESTLAVFDPSFRGGVRTAVGDVTGDGIPDVVAAAGPGGGPHVKVFDGRTGAVVRSFYAYHAGFVGGVEVAVGDVNRDGYGDIITGAGSGGGPHVKAFDGRTGSEIRSFYAYAPNFTGGVFVASGDLNRDGYEDVITGAGAGGGPHVTAFDGRTGAVLNTFYAFNPRFAGGVRVASGDLNGDGIDDVIAAAGPGGGPHVKAFDSPTGRVLFDRFAADPSFRDGVRVTTVPAFGSYDGRDGIITRTRYGDVVDTTAYQSTSDTSGLELKVWVGDGAPPPGSETGVVIEPRIASGVLPVRAIQGAVTSVADDGRSMTLARGDGSSVTLDLSGDPPAPDGAVYIEGSIDPAEFFRGDQPATLADIQPGRWVRVKVGRAYDLAQTNYIAMEVQVL